MPFEFGGEGTGGVDYQVSLKVHCVDLNVLSLKCDRVTMRVKDYYCVH